MCRSGGCEGCGLLSCYLLQSGKSQLISGILTSSCIKQYIMLNLARSLCFCSHGSLTQSKIVSISVVPQ